MTPAEYFLDYLQAMGRGEQSRLAKVTGYSQPLIHQLSKGQRQFTKDNAIRIATASYGVLKAKYLLGLEPIPAAEKEKS